MSRQINTNDVRKSIRGDIILFIIVSTCAVSLLIVTANFLFLNKKIRQVRENEISSTFNYYLNTINNLTDRMESNVLALAHTGELVYQNRSKLTGAEIDQLLGRYLVSQVHEVPVILGGGLWYEPYAVSPERRYTGPYAYWKDGTVHLTWEYSNSTYRYDEHAWYTMALPKDWDRAKRREKKVYISPPYPDRLNRRDVLFVTMSAPMYGPSGRITGVATTDWSIDVIRQNLKDFFITPSSCVFLIDRTSGMFLYHTDPELIMKPAKSLSWASGIGDDLAGTAPVTVYGTSSDLGKFILTYTATSAGFIFGSLISHAEVFSTINDIIAINIAIIIGFMAALGVLIYLSFNRMIIRPLMTVAEFGNRIAGGDRRPLEANLRNDELGTLAAEFNDMAAKLDESISTVSSIIEFNPSMIITIAPDGSLIQWNRAAELLLIDKEKPPVEPLKIWDVNPVFGMYREEISRVMTEKSHSVHYKVSIDGFPDRLFNIHFFALERKLDTLLAIRIDDVTELEKKEVQIIRSQKLETIGLLAGGIAHDFNNILTGILGTASLLRMQLKKDGDIPTAAFDEDLAVIEKASESGASIVAQLLNLSRRDSDSDLSPADLNQVVRQVLSIGSKSFDKSVELTAHYNPTPAFVSGNITQLQQCILNLCINAVHSMTIMRGKDEKKGGILQVDISGIEADKYFLESHIDASPGRYWKLSIRDTGVGMDSRTLSKIFDPFFTTKQKDESRGSGLGLLVVNSILRNHHGFLNVYSDVGSGSVFNLYFPECAGECAVMGMQERVEQLRGSGTILIIDDDETVRNSAAAMLEACGFTVLSAGDGTEGLTIYKKKSPAIDLVLLDMVMPKISGQEVFEKLMRTDPALKVVLTSGLYNGELIDLLRERGAKGFIQKPYTITRLFEGVQSVLTARTGDGP